MQTNQNNNTFYVVSMSKFTLLYLSTMGLYGLYWVFKNWQLLGRAQNRSTLPILRGLLSVIFLPLLCFEIRKEEAKRGQNYPWKPRFLALLFAVVTIADLVISHAILNEQIAAGWLLVTPLLLLLTYYIFYKLQLVINRIEGDPFGEQNSAITPINQAWIIFGLFRWISWVYTLYLIFNGQLDLAPVPPPA